MTGPGDSDRGRGAGRAATRAPGQPQRPPAIVSRRRLWGTVRAAAIAAIIAGSAIALYAERATIASGVASFRQSNLGWVMAGFAAECVSMAAFALLQQRLLLAAGTRLTVGPLLAIAYTSNAITLAVPVAGSGLATAYSQRRFRGRGADTAAVSLALLIAGVISTVAFAVVVAVGAVASGNPAAAILGLLTSLGCAAAAALIVVILHSPRGRARLRRPAGRVIRLVQRVAHRPAGDAAAIAARALERLGSFNLGLATIGSAFGWALINWVADVACLAAAIAAIGVAVPWGKLLLIWSAGAAAASFSPTPYGLGVVDIALIAALRGAGLASPDAVGAVLLYRIITFKILVTLLWIGYRNLTDHRRRR
jgi:putative heme transporter